MYVFGPVPSRRLGRSLGVSPIPAKTCSFSCVYCQLGQTRRTQIQRKPFAPRQDILNEICKISRQSAPDFITFAGDGEPTLCLDLGWLIRQTKAQTSTPVAVITNSSLLNRMDVRQDLASADVLLPSLDAADEAAFKAINRPHSAVDFDAIIEGLVKLRQQAAGQIWLEIMLVKGINDTSDDFHRMKAIVARIKPDRIYFMTPTRPPAERWVEPVDSKTVLQAQKIIGDATPLIDVESDDLDLATYPNARHAILDVIHRHPLRVDQAKIIAAHFAQAQALDHMIQNGILVPVEYQGQMYLRATAHAHDRAPSHR